MFYVAHRKATIASFVYLFSLIGTRLDIEPNARSLNMSFKCHANIAVTWQ